MGEWFVQLCTIYCDSTIETKFLVPDRGIYCSRLLHYRVVVPARQPCSLAGRYNNPMPESTISPSQGLRIWLLPTDIILQCTMLYMHSLKLTLSLEHKIKRKENGMKMSSLKIGPLLPFSFSLLTILARSRIAFFCRCHSNSDPSLSQIKSSTQIRFYWTPYWKYFFFILKVSTNWTEFWAKATSSLGHDEYSIWFGKSMEKSV